MLERSPKADHAAVGPAAVLVEEIGSLFIRTIGGNSALQSEFEDLNDLHGLILDRVAVAVAALAQRGRIAWQPMETAPRDGRRFWGRVDGDAIGMVWHPEFRAFVSSWQRMTMAPGLTIDGAGLKDHSPTIHHPTAWMEIPDDAIAPAAAREVARV